MTTKGKIRFRTLHYRLFKSMAMTFLLLNGFSSLAQYSQSWDILYGGDNFDELHSVVEVSDGFVYGAAAAASTLGDPPPTAGSADYWIYKTDFAGNILWSYTYGGSDVDILQKMIPTLDGGFLMAGFSFSNASGFKQEDSRGERDVWLVKVDANGIFSWEGTYGGDQEDYATSIIQAQDGSYYFGGWTGSLVSGEVSLPTRGGQFDFWVGHVDSNGNLLDDFRFGGPNVERIFDMEQLPGGDILLAGLSDSNIGGDKTEDSFGGEDVWLIRMNQDGTIDWNKTYGGSGKEQGRAILECPSGGYLIGAFSNSPVSGNKTAPNIGGADYWLFKIDDLGNLVYDRTYGGMQDDELDEIKINDKDLIYMGGRSNSNIGGDKSEVNRGKWDYWIVVVDEDDTVFYDKTLGGDMNDLLTDFEILDGGGILWAGFTESNTSGDITDVNNGTNDNWVVFSACTLDGNLNIGDDQMVCEYSDQVLSANTGQFNVCSTLWFDNSTEIDRTLFIDEDVEISVTVRDIYGCIAQDTVAYTIFDAPEFDLGTATIGLCIGEDTLISTGLDEMNNSFEWNDSSQDSERVLLIPGFYELTVTDMIGCTFADTVIIENFAQPSFDLGDDFNLCEGDSKIIDVDDPGPTYEWSVPNVNSSELEVTEAGKYFVTVTNSNGCQEVDSVEVTAVMPPIVDLGLTQNICQGDLLTLDATVAGCNSCTYLWEDDSTSPIREFIPQFNETYSVEVTDPSTMCNSIDEVTVNIFEISIRRLDESTCFPSEVGIDTIFSINQFGCDSLTITNTEQLRVDTMNFDIAVCTPDEVRIDTLVDLNLVGCDSLSIINFFLAVNEEELTLMTCDLNQVDKDTLVETNMFGCDSIIFRTFVKLRNDTTELQAYICDAPAFQDTVFLLNEVGCDSMIITVFEEASSNDIQLMDFTCDEDQAGIQVFQLENQFGCDSTVTIDFQFIDNIVTHLEEDTCDPSQFIPDTLIFPTAQCDSLVVTNYTVRREDETVLEFVSCDMNDVGTTSIVLSNQFGCDSTVISVVEFSEEDITNLSEFECSRTDTLIQESFFMNQFGCDSTVVTTIFPGLDTTFNITNVCDVAEIFEVENMFVSMDGCDSIVVDRGVLSDNFESVFEIFTCNEGLVGSTTLNFTSVEGCDSVVIFNTLLGEIEIIQNIRNIACGEIATGEISVQGNAGQVPYLYNIDGGEFSTSSVFDELEIGVYQVGLQDANGCESSVEVEIVEVTGVGISLPDFVALDYGDPLILNPIIEGDFVDFFWTGIDSLFCETCINQNYVPLTSNAITLNVLSAEGCLEKHQVIFAVEKNYDVYIPNAFSPNDDSVNDFFMVFGDGNIKEVKSLSLYTRWGEQVFEGFNLSPNDEPSGWDGMHKGEKMNPGLFVYKVQVEFFDGNIEDFEGDFSLLR